MTFTPSVTQWIEGLKGGDTDAAQHLWDRYFQRLVALARDHIGPTSRGGVDSEDVAQSVFKSLCLGVERGRYPRITDRDNLWTLLVAMTAYKSWDLLRREGALKRGGGRVMDEAALGNHSGPIDGVIGREPTPQFALQMAEQCQMMLGLLTVAERQTAELKLQGFSNYEIAKRLGCAMRTVERRLVAVRRAWSAKIDEERRDEGSVPD